MNESAQLHLKRGSWPLTIVNDILQQMPAVRQPQRQFLATLFATILTLRGRITFRHLSRYCDYSERTIARQFRVSFAWPDFPQRVMTAALDPRATLISAQAASFIPKSGKQTCGLGHFFNGCANRAERGLEISTLAVVADAHDLNALASWQLDYLCSKFRHSTLYLYAILAEYLIGSPTLAR